jgi:osmotically-inducible protein OsmY
MSHGTHTIASLLFACVLLGAAACGDTRADREIAVKVDRELSNSPVLGNAQIDVAARDGVVTLTGVAATEEQAKSAEQLAWSVEGVEAVESRIRVALAPDPTGLPPVGAEPMPPTDETR